MSAGAQQHYANGMKGLGHFASYLVPEMMSYAKPNYEQSNLYGFYGEQTEKPFKASPYMGSHYTPASQDSYSEQSVTNVKPLNSYIPQKESLASNSYVVNKEYQHLNTYNPPKGAQSQGAQVAQPQGSHAPQVSKSYLPASKGYAPAMQHYEVSQFSYQKPANNVQNIYVKDDQISNSYLPQQELSYASYAPSMEYQISNHYPEKQAQNSYQISSIYPSKEIQISNTYLPTKHAQISHTYLPQEHKISSKPPVKETQVTNSYLPPMEVQSPNHYATTTYKESTPSNSYLPSKEFLPPKHTASTQSYEKPATQFLAPSKAYLPSSSNSNSYTTPKVTYTIQPVKTYLPAKNAYPTSPPKNTYLPSQTSQAPSNAYLPTQHYAVQETSLPHSEGQAQAFETEQYQQSPHLESQQFQHSGTSQYIPQHSYNTQEYAPSH